MAERHRRDRPIGLGQLQARYEHHRRMNDVAMGEHRALRPPCRARGVEDHGGVFFADLDRRCQRRVIGQIRKAREFRIVIDRDPVRHIGNVARIGHTVGQRGLVDQEPRAAIGQHIGDLGLLLAGRKQHRHQPGMGRAQHRQHEFGSVAEQHRDAVAALEAELLKSCCDLRRLPRDFAPCHSRCAADQRLAIAVSRHGFGHHRRDALGPFAKCRNDTVAEARFEPHRRNGVLRPVHGAPRQLFFIS